MNCVSTAEHIVILSISFLQNTLSPNPVAAAAGVNFSSVRQVHVSAAVGGMIGSGVRNQVVMSPRGPLIMAQTIPPTAAATPNISSELKSVPALGKGVVGPVFGVNVINSAASQSCLTTSTAVSRGPVVSVSQASMTLPASMETAAESTATSSSQVAQTTTTVTVTTSACSLATTTATTVHAALPLTTTINVLPHISASSWEHKLQSSPLGSQSSDLDAKEESGRGSMSPSTPSTAASTSTHESMSGDCGKMDGGTVKVPYSWRRVVENGTVVYFR